MVGGGGASILPHIVELTLKFVLLVSLSLKQNIIQKNTQITNAELNKLSVTEYTYALSTQIKKYNISFILEAF